VVRSLLQEGADINAQFGPYGNALLSAVLRGREDVVQVLLDSGADNRVGGEWNLMYNVENNVKDPLGSYFLAMCRI
jgi:ankyrin repeat protein